MLESIVLAILFSLSVLIGVVDSTVEDADASIMRGGFEQPGTEEPQPARTLGRRGDVEDHIIWGN